MSIHDTCDRCPNMTPARSSAPTILVFCTMRNTNPTISVLATVSANQMGHPNSINGASEAPWVLFRFLYGTQVASVSGGGARTGCLPSSNIARDATPAPTPLGTLRLYGLQGVRR